MNIIAIIVKSSFTAIAWCVQRRPVSHAAAAVFVITSNMVAHEGLMAWLPGKLGWALTALFGAVSVLQWLGLGRQDACLDAKDHDRADAVIHQAWIFGAIETALFAAGVLAIAAADGLPVYAWPPICGALAGAALFAYVNFRVKWVSCDAVTARRTASQPAHHVLFSANLPALPAPDGETAETARFTSDAGIIDFEEMLARRDRQVELDGLAKASATRTPDERLQLAIKRLQTRHRRALKRAA